MIAINGTDQAPSIGTADYIGDDHLATSIDTPMKSDAFILEDDEKMQIIEEHFAQIMDTLGLDLTDDSLRGTPRRVAKMFVQEIFYGLDPSKKPRISLFDNKYQYSRMLVERNITVKSYCEHHFQPILGRCHVGYISNGKVIGLSKINRLVDYYARRPQVQERLTRQILEGLQDALGTKDVIVVVDAIHQCVTNRGIQDQHSSTLTIDYSGRFEKNSVRQEFMELLKQDLNQKM